MSEDYIRNHFDDINKYSCIIEDRLDDSCLTAESVLEDNRYYSAMAEKHNVNTIFINDSYEADIDL